MSGDRNRQQIDPNSRFVNHSGKIPAIVMDPLTIAGTKLRSRLLEISRNPGAENELTGKTN